MRFVFEREKIMRQGRPRETVVSNRYHLNLETCRRYLKKVPIELLAEELSSRAETERADFICAKLRLLRSELGLTQKSLALVMRVSTHSVFMAERGLRKSAAEKYMKFLVMIKEERQIKEREDARKVAAQLQGQPAGNPQSGRPGLPG
jgi:DNA-binding XRE family transcriptional regulator